MITWQVSVTLLVHGVLAWLASPLLSYSGPVQEFFLFVSLPLLHVSEGFWKGPRDNFDCNIDVAAASYSSSSRLSNHIFLTCSEQTHNYHQSPKTVQNCLGHCSCSFSKKAIFLSLASSSGGVGGLHLPWVLLPDGHDWNTSPNFQVIEQRLPLHAQDEHTLCVLFNLNLQIPKVKQIFKQTKHLPSSMKLVHRRRQTRSSTGTQRDWSWTQDLQLHIDSSHVGYKIHWSVPWVKGSPVHPIVPYFVTHQGEPSK